MSTLSGEKKGLVETASPVVEALRQIGESGSKAFEKMFIQTEAINWRHIPAHTGKHDGATGEHDDAFDDTLKNEDTPEEGYGDEEDVGDILPFDFRVIAGFLATLVGVMAMPNAHVAFVAGAIFAPSMITAAICAFLVYISIFGLRGIGIRRRKRAQTKKK